MTADPRTDPDPTPNDAREQADALAASIYEELRRLAAHRLAGERPGQTLQPTALVHEVYLRLVGRREPRCYADRRDFFAAAATAMRNILIEHARRKQTQKRSDGGRRRQPLEDVAAPHVDQELLALNEALQRLAERDALKAKLVELRYFAGLTGDEAAAVLGISPTTADRYWAYARAWLQAEVKGYE